MSSSELTPEDIQKLISDAENETFKKLPAIKICNYELDLQSFHVFWITVMLWIIIWFTFKIFKLVNYAEYFFWFYILISFLNFYNSATNVSDAETERININSQQSFIQGGLSVFILAFVFLSNISIPEEQKTSIYIILAISLIICTIGVILINIKNESVNIRFVRKIQQSVYNQAVILFMLGLYMIYTFKIFKNTKN